MITRIRAVSALALLVSLGLLSAAPAGRAAAPSPAPAATRPPDALARTADEVAREVEQLRGWKFKRPVKKERISLARAHLDMQRMLLASDKPEHRAKVQAFLRVAGLIPPDCNLVDTSMAVLDQQVAGYYEPATRTLRLVDRPNPLPPFVERMVLSHELTHALDDQYVDLADMLKKGGGTEDSDFVATAVGEGSATSLMLQEMAAGQKAGRFTLADLSQYVADELERARTIEQLPRYFSAMFGSYIVGAAFLARGDLSTILAQPDNRAIGEALLTARHAMPQSSEQLLHPEKYWDPASRDDPVIIDDKSMTLWLARPGRHIVHRDTLGELLTAILTEPHGAKRDLMRLQSIAAWTNAGASGWGGDRFFLLADQPGPNALRTIKGLQGVWVTTWDTPKDRDKFLAALENGSPPPNSVSAAVGRQMAVVFIGLPAEERSSLLRRLDLMPLTMTRDGRAWTQ
jgi:hypothetical protein